MEPIIFLPNWENNEGIKPKLVRLLKIIDKESRKETILLMGISAGASLVMNAFVKKLDKVEKAVSLCGRLKLGWSKNKVNKKLQQDSLKNRAFKQSVKLAENNIKGLGKIQKKRILTVSAKFGDELIPIGTSKIEGVKNISLPRLGHLLSITAGMTVKFGPIKKFLLYGK